MKKQMIKELKQVKMKTIFLLFFCVYSIAFNVNFVVARSSDNINFVVSRDFNAGQNLDGMADADFNGDGKRDIAVVNSNPTNRISILLGNGDGTFQSPTFFNSEANAKKIVAADFNRDNKADIAVTAATSGTITVYLGNGNGTFSNSNFYTIGTNPNEIGTGDFNNDTNPDIAAVNIGSGTVSILIGNGEGGFATAVSYTAIPSAMYLAIGDKNNDGKEDLVVGSASSVAILYGNGNGTFGTATVTNFAGIRSVALADFQNDGVKDIAIGRTLDSTGNATILGVSNVNLIPLANTNNWKLNTSDLNADGREDVIMLQEGAAVSVFLQKTLPSVIEFNAPIHYDTGIGAIRSMVVADFNNDGSKDVVVNKVSAVNVLLNEGTGKLQAGFKEMAFGTGGLRDLLIGKMNDDNFLDLVRLSGNNSPSPTATVFLGSLSGKFSLGPVNSVATGNWDRGEAALGDFNSDNKTDILVCDNLSLGGTPITRVNLWEGTGNGSVVSTGRSFAGPDIPQRIAINDFNGDGNSDMAVADRSGIVKVWNGNGQGTFGNAVEYAFASNVMSRDFNNDGRIDLIGTQGSSVKIRLNQGNGTFADVITLPTNVTLSANYASADLNNDGKMDFVIGTNGYIVLLGNGQGDFSVLSNQLIANFVPTSVKTADFNLDGKQDLVFGSNSGLIKVFIGVGNGTFNESLTFVSTESNLIQVGDFNSDLLPDIAASSSGNVAVFLNNSTASVNNRKFDFDGDGKSDISVFRPNEGIWYLNRSSQGFAAAQFGITTDKLTPADFDGDGKTDISVYRDGIWYWLNSSTNSFSAVQFGIAGDIPQPADFSGDGRAELAVYRGGTWWTYNLASNQAATVQFGIPTDKPVIADYDGDGKADHAVYRDGTWYVLQSTNGFTAGQFGLASDKPVPADYDGDGKTDWAVYRDGVWYVLRSSQGFFATQFGISTDIPVAADYDGDGKADVAVYRNGTWYLSQSSNGISIQQFGIATDKPVPAAFIP